MLHVYVASRLHPCGLKNRVKSKFYIIIGCNSSLNRVPLLMRCWGFIIGCRHTRLESKENQQRPVNRTYYYVDFRATIDVVKYRMHKVVRDVERKMNKVSSTFAQCWIYLRSFSSPGC